MQKKYVRGAMNILMTATISPSWQQLCEEDREFANHEIRKQQYRSLYDGEEFTGFVQLFPLLNVIRLGIFLAPQFCGKGLGQHAVQAAVHAARELNPSAEIDLEVETWNKRAVACYEKCGFKITDQYEYFSQGSIKKVFCMVYTL